MIIIFNDNIKLHGQECINLGLYSHLSCFGCNSGAIYVEIMDKEVFYFLFTPTVGKDVCIQYYDRLPL